MRGQMRSCDNGRELVVQENFEKVTGARLDKYSIRLLPYIQYVLMNEQKFDRLKMSEYERSLVRDFKSKGCLFDLNGHARCTLEFWTVLNEILYLAYVDYEMEH